MTQVQPRLGKVHLVIPCLNESGRISMFLRDLCSATKPAGHIDILVVDDGSGHDEQVKLHKIVESLRPEFPHLQSLLCLSANIGKGGAVYAGWDMALDADILAFVDADGSCSASETVRLIHHARSNPDSETTWIGSRIKMLGRRINRLFKRHILGRVFATVVSELLDIDVYDSQCGLKLIPNAVYQKIAPHLNLKKFAFDVELIVRILDAGYPVKEFPIDWHETPDGKVHILRDSWLMFKDVFWLRSKRHIK